MTASRALPTRAVAKVWGRDVLPAPFHAPAGERIGEIWFEPPPEMPQILVKYLFTSEKLSVQVHPSDSQAMDGEDGKEECWLVLGAEPGAELAIGFLEPIGKDTMRAAALDGSIEQLLEWIPVSPGDFFYLKPGTVHAIGAGITLVEIQQNSDTTFRLYDYGRPRELHLDRAMAVADGKPFAEELRQHLSPTGSVTVVEGAHFRLDRLSGPPDAATCARYGGNPLLVIPLDAPVALSTGSIAPGGCGYAETLDELEFAAGRNALIVQPVPA